jgi:hypothetical protein
MKNNMDTKTACPIANSLINMGYLSKNDNWKEEDVRNSLQKIKTSKVFSYMFTYVLKTPLKKKNLPFSIKSMQKHNVIEHDVSLSREDFHLGNHIEFNKKRFNLIYAYFKDQEYITFKELIEYMHHLYKKSKKENPELTFKTKQLSSMLSEMSIIFILLSNNNRLSLRKLQTVFENETLDNIKINRISTFNFTTTFTKAAAYWTNARLKK